MNGPKLALVLLVAFCLPVAVAMLQYREEIQKRFEVNPRTSKGRLLYFTLPSG